MANDPGAAPRETVRVDVLHSDAMRVEVTATSTITAAPRVGRWQVNETWTHRCSRFDVGYDAAVLACNDCGTVRPPAAPQRETGQPDDVDAAFRTLREMEFVARGEGFISSDVIGFLGQYVSSLESRLAASTPARTEAEQLAIERQEADAVSKAWDAGYAFAKRKYAAPGTPRGEPTDAMVEAGVGASEMTMEVGMAKRPVPAKVVRRIIAAALRADAGERDHGK